MHPQDPTPPSRWRSPLGIFMLVAGAVGIYYLLTEHLTPVSYTHLTLPTSDLV